MLLRLRAKYINLGVNGIEHPLKKIKTFTSQISYILHNRLYND